MTDNKKEKDLIENSKTLSDAKKKEMKANMDQQKEIDHSDRADSDLYAKTEGKDPETGIEIPTEESVEEAKEWVDNENRM
ncbi:MAG: DUF3787 domain-containing protein [Peptoniphilus harei]|uniref:CDIF630_02480 family spore surface protein n=1 Tax=Peptoniphilus harei TaxID=54005 RepID=UPI002551623F|nr:DUF3787 domain-containing protein [Peptoniphilus harei]MDK7754733.1 DUF3787 domain-containing protein [Peptoniphilus harei]MDK7760539.1 DUF3787 domain-containing protein [Peptoniphilus harei]MDK8270330.1 DUF3787 domain-containing protein [Peptoniphilus harei]MDK8338789.1 DUF3787 domain-containing protein [Peptoniphilus harei]